jgi:hypothetical protein
MSPTYLGAALDSSLTVQISSDQLRQFLDNAILLYTLTRGTSWGANAVTLRITGLALVIFNGRILLPCLEESVHIREHNRCSIEYHTSNKNG